ncbi:MAG: CHAT domain-containing protein [Deltaproteobacteria bacterium]|nr:CHAT domain-containing protein [Deltaproteobacteria bacterium]
MRVALALALVCAVSAAGGGEGARWPELVREGEALARIGSTREAISLLEQAVRIAIASGDPARTAASRAALGQALLAAGDLPGAQRELLAAAELAEEADDAKVSAAVWGGLGNLRAAESDPNAALAAYAKAVAAADTAGDSASAFRFEANGAWLSAAEGDLPTARLWLARARSRGEALPDAEAPPLAWIQLGRAAVRSARRDPPARDTLLRQAHADLSRALDLASATGDEGAASWALGYLGELYEGQARFSEALELTRRAQRKAEEIQAPETELLWRIQAGRLEQMLGRRDAAIADYETALEGIAAQRHALSRSVGPGRLDYREQVTSVHLALVDLLLQRAAEGVAPERVQADLQRAQQAVERYKASELRDYFRDECVDAYRERLTDSASVSANAAVVYPIALPDRLEILVSGPLGIRQFTVGVPSELLDAEVRSLRSFLVKRTSRQYLRPAQKLHHWLIEPIARHLANLAVDTLVFVPGGMLRTIPMSALHDGEAFLVERYAVAITPGLELTDPRPIDRQALSLFLGGLSESVQGYPALEHVAEEINAVHALYGGNVLIDEAFTKEKIERSLRAHEFSIVHVATHGEFGGSADDSFLLTHDGRLSMDELASSVGAFRYRDTPLELILLSACDTARGDERAALGLAGIAVKAGARSALGTLWKVNDQAAAKIIVGFYERLSRPGVSRAQALRGAQLPLIADPLLGHPAYWSPFLLISSWL